MPGGVLVRRVDNLRADSPMRRSRRQTSEVYIPEDVIKCVVLQIRAFPVKHGRQLTSQRLCEAKKGQIEEINS